MLLTWPFVFQNSGNADSNSHECLPKVTWHGAHDWASMSAQFLWRKQLVASSKRSDIPCHASCPHSWLFVVSFFSCVFFPFLPYPGGVWVCTPRLCKSPLQTSVSSCPLPSYVESQKPRGILANTFYVFSSRFHEYFVEAVEFLANDFI